MDEKIETTVSAFIKNPQTWLIGFERVGLFQ
jgi:hypothetical protein